MIKKYNEVDIIGINFENNGGKGHAVINGMKYARGEKILMVDADGATDIKDYEKLDQEIKKIQNQNSEGIVIGSRYILSDDSVVEVNYWIKS